MICFTGLVLLLIAAFFLLLIGNRGYDAGGAVLSRIQEATNGELPHEEIEEKSATDTSAETIEIPVQTEINPIQLSIVAYGCVSMPRLIRERFLQPDGSYDFSRLFVGFDPLFEKADVGIATLEMMTTTEAEAMNTHNGPVEVLDALQQLGVGFVSLATERMLDKGYEGLTMTRNELMRRAIEPVGAEETSGSRYTMISVGGMKVALLAYTYGISEEGKRETNDDELQIAHTMDMDAVQRDILEAKIAGADLIVLQPHWGVKNNADVTTEMREAAYKMAKAGADIIIGCHSGVVSEVEDIRVTRSDGLPYHTLVCYSLGSLVSDARTQQNTASLAVCISLSYIPETRKITFERIEGFPVYVAQNTDESWNILNCQDAESVLLLSETEKEKMEEAVKMIHETVHYGGMQW